MKHRVRKWWSFLLCLAMVINIIPITAAAADEGIAIDETNFPDAVFRECASNMIRTIIKN